jgi:hypothetical protein
LLTLGFGFGLFDPSDWALGNCGLAVLFIGFETAAVGFDGVGAVIFF